MTDTRAGTRPCVTQRGRSVTVNTVLLVLVLDTAVGVSLMEAPQVSFFRDKHMLRQTLLIIGRDKNMFVEKTNTFCRDKHPFVETEDVFCRDKNDTCGSSRQ